MFGINTLRRVKYIASVVKGLDLMLDTELRETSGRHQVVSAVLNKILANVQMTHSITISQLRAQAKILEMQRVVIADTAPIAMQIQLALMTNDCYEKYGLDIQVPIPTPSPTDSNHLSAQTDIGISTANYKAKAIHGSHYIPDQSAIDHGGAAMFGIGVQARAIAQKAPNTGEQITQIIPGDSDADGSK